MYTPQKGNLGVPFNDTLFKFSALGFCVCCVCMFCVCVCVCVELNVLLDSLTLIKLDNYLYRVTHKRWDCKDDLKLWNHEDPKVKLRLLPWIYCLLIAYYIIGKENNKFKVWKCRQYNCRTTVSEVSSFMGNPVLYKPYRGVLRGLCEIYNFHWGFRPPVYVRDIVVCLAWKVFKFTQFTQLFI